MVIQRVAGAGLGARTCAARGGACLSSAVPQNGDTALHLAAMMGHATVVEKLLAAGADKEAKNMVRRAGNEGCR